MKNAQRDHNEGLMGNMSDDFDEIWRRFGEGYLDKGKIVEIVLNDMKHPKPATKALDTTIY